MAKPDPQNDSLSAFFALTFLLSVPFYVLNALAHLNVVGKPEMGAVYIAAFTVTPIASASILTFRRRGGRGVKELLGRPFDFKRIVRRRWYAVILLLPPFTFVLTLGCLVLSGAPMPPALVPLVAAAAVLPFFFLLAVGEEVGWMGYAFETMQARSSALQAALGLGLVWALWHVPFFVFIMPDPVRFGAQVLTLVGTRVLVVWIFNNTGRSVFAAILFHAVDNTALVVLPEIAAITDWGAVVRCGIVMVSAVAVTMLWGAGTMTRYRFPGEHRPGEE